MSGGPHSVGFRVMRLTRNALNPSKHLALDLETDFLPDDEAAEVFAARKASNSTASSSSRSHITSPLQICNIDGLLELPTSFGPLHLGEAFQSYISVVNLSQQPIQSLYCKVELETKRAKATLHDSTKSGPISLSVGGRHDFIVRHEIKDIGQHSLNCIVAYTAQNQDQRTFSQHYNFSSENPLSVRTKWRLIQEMVLLEACIENVSKIPMILDYVKLDPTPPLTVETVRVQPEEKIEKDPLTELKSIKIVSPQGGAYNLLFKIRNGANGNITKGDHKVLGKLDIKWRNSLGEVGRLQTQPIAMTSFVSKEVSLDLEEMGSNPLAEEIFEMVIRIDSKVDRKLRDLSIKCLQDEAEDILPLGPISHEIDELPANGNGLCKLSFLPRRAGMLKCPKLELCEADSQIALDTIQPSVLVM